MKATLENRVEINLKPGDLYVTNKPIIIKTLLGSCVSLALYNKHKKVAALSHAQLPYELFNGKCRGNCPVKCDLNSNNRFKFVTCSTRHMIEQFETFGIKKNEIEVKLFGGANVIDASSKNNKPIGEQNIESAIKVIDEYGLKLVSKDIGGKVGRNLYFDVGSGSVFVQKHKKTN